MPSASGARTTRTRIVELDAQITVLKLALHALLAERSSCQNALDAVKYLILILPNEITSEIFVNFLPSPPRHPPAVGPFSPSFLDQICRKWRDVALSTPSLWSALRLNLDRVELQEQQLCLLQTWLERSKNCSLSIAL
ncbi:hypothetical protein DFH09DRAFT_899429, partial [Mycena vulgaris]